MVRSGLFCGAAGAALLACVAPGAASAQTTTAGATSPTPASPATAQVGEIIVTAQRRAENIQAVPVAVTPVSAQLLEQQNIQQPSQLVFAVPSLQQQATNGETGATDFSIRGVGTAVFGPGIESSVATVIDDVTLARPQLGVTQFFDLDNIQVLSGPQGMLFGKNASAGVVSINSNRPKLGVTSTDVETTIGVHDSIGSPLLFNGDATFNAPLGDTAAVRVSLFGVSNDSPVTNVYRDTGDLGLREFGARAKLLWNPTDRLEVYLLADYAHEYGVGDGLTTERANAAGGLLATLTQQASVLGLATVKPSADNLQIASDGPETQRFNSGGVQANLRYRLDGGYTLTNILAYRQYTDAANGDADYLPFTFGNSFGGGGLERDRNIRQVSEELRLTSPENQRLTYQLGVYFLDLHYLVHFDQQFDLNPAFPQPPPGVHVLGVKRREVIDSDSEAVFGQAEYHFTDNFKLLFGGRYTHDSIDGHNTFDASASEVPLLPSGDTRDSATADNFSFRVGPEYQLGPSLLYFTYSRGYKGPALDETSLDVVRPEIPTSYEGGVKTSLFDRRVQVDLALFRTDYDQFQAQALVQTGSSDNYLTVNAGSLRVQGVEAQVRAAPVSGLSITGGATFLDAHYTDFTGAPCYPNEPQAPSGRFVCLPSGRSDISGGRLANAPKWASTVTSQYTHPIGRGLNGFVGADIYYRDSINYTPSPDPQTRVGPITLVGATVGVQDEARRWRIAVFARNIFDKRFPTFIAPNPFGAVGPDNSKLTGDYAQTFGQESFRTVGVQLSGRF